MPKFQDTLKRILVSEFRQTKYPRVSQSDFEDSEFHNEILKVYRALNGRLPEYPTQFRGFDIQLGHCIVELDEEQHFNRYRALTLRSDIYRKLKGFSVKDYISYCQEFEPRCLRKASYGNYWGSTATSKQFQGSSTCGDLAGSGPSRWRQRAFYDFLRDSGQHIFGYKLVRVSVYSKVNGMTVGQILGGQLESYYPLLIDLVDRKTS